MGSKPQDSATQQAASTGAQTTDATLDANAAQNQAFANQTRQSLFGTYDPTTNSYTGGTESQFLNPSTLNTTGLTGAYANLYNTQANQSAQAAQQGVQTTLQNLQSRGMGATPAGFAADQYRQAYQNQANTNAQNYSSAFTNQHNEALNQFNLANQMLNNNSVGSGSLAGSEYGTAAGNYSGLYGTASQQVPTGLQSTINDVTGLGTAGASAYKNVTGCWVAAEIFGGWMDPRTIRVRSWMFGPFRRTLAGRMVSSLYLRWGERTAAAIRRFPLLRPLFTILCEAALRRAEREK